MNSQGEHLKTFATDEHDTTSYRKRVQAWIDGRSVRYEDTSFVTGDSPVVMAVNTDLGRNAHSGYVVCDGAGNFTVEISDNGTNYGGVHTLKSGEILDLDNMVINKIRISWISNNSYRVFAI